MTGPVQCYVAFVTAPDIETARKISRGALEKKLCACANLVPGLESHYWWQGKLEESAEVLIIFKMTLRQRETLRDFVVANHPYDVPEFIAFPIEHGSDDYLNWVRQSVGSH
jgi:periplasmic divalent cation tolerance protein